MRLRFLIERERERERERVFDYEFVIVNRVYKGVL